MASHKAVTRANAHPPGAISDYLDATDQASDPAAPAAGTHRVYSKSGGVYVEDSTGTVTGPLGTGGGSGGTPAVVLGTTAAAGVATTFLRDDDTIAAFDTTAPVTQAFGDAAATGSAAVAARRDHKHGMPSDPVSFATPSVALGTAAAAGVATTVIRSDGTIAAFDATTPTTSAVGDAAATGSAAFAARRDHTHGREGFGTTGSSAVGDAAAAGTATTVAHSDHVHGREAFGAVSAQTSFGASSGNGTATTVSHSDHTHGTPVINGATQGTFFGFTDQASDPATPSAGTHDLYSKSGGIYVKDSSGTVTGPLGTGGASSPLTTKGDLYGYDTADARIPVGGDGEAFFADSQQSLGVAYSSGGRYGLASRVDGNVLAGPQGLGTIAIMPAVNSPKSGQVPLGPNTVTVEGSASHYRSFPGLAMMRNGQLLAVWRDGSAHVSTDGDIKGAISSDLGQTWGTEFTIRSHTTEGNDCRDPMLTVLSDGRVALSYFAENSTPVGVAVKVMFSADNGSTWGSPVAVTTSYSADVACSSAIVELSDGTLLLAIYGYASGTTYNAAVVKSTDGGASFGSQVTIVATDGTKTYSETALILSGTTVIALVREDTTKSFYRSTSTDGGATWGSATSVLSGYGRPAPVKLASGGIAMAFRDASTAYADYSTSWDDGSTWATAAALDSTTETYEYAQMVQLAGGVAAVLYALEVSSSRADLFLRYLVDGFGTMLPDGTSYVSSGTPVNVGTGSSFPGTPSDGDLYYRLDLDLLFRYNGALTKWLTERIVWPLSMGTADVTFTANTTLGYIVWPSGFDLYVLEFHAMFNIASGNGASNYWTLRLQAINTTPTTTNITSVNSSAGGASGWYQKDATSVNVTETASAGPLLRVSVEKTGSPGAIGYIGCSAVVQLIHS